MTIGRDIETKLLANGKRSNLADCLNDRVRKQRESEAPAELATPWFGRSLTLPSNELVGQSRCDHVYRGDLTLPNLESIV